MATCPICSTSIESATVKLRSGKSSSLNHCTSCNFSFFPYDPTASLSDGNLETTRLASAGLNIPSLDQDFANTLSQAHYYCNKYSLTEINPLKILDFDVPLDHF